jgi:hypothetical protein
VRVRAKWAFSAEREGELSMGVGDVLAIIDQTNQNWWMAELGGKRGVVPANYVEILPDEPALPGTRPTHSTRLISHLSPLIGRLIRARRRAAAGIANPQPAARDVAPR